MSHHLRQTLFVPPVPLVIAQQHGYLTDADLTLDTAVTRSSTEQLEQLMSGERDVAVTAIDNLIIWNSGGADIRMIAQVERTTSLGLYVPPRIGSLHQLSGARFAVDAAANGFAVVAKYLIDSLGITGVEYVEVGGVRERLEALLAGTVDAALLGPPLDEMAEAAGFTRLVKANELVQDFPGQGLMIRDSRREELGPALRAYLGALGRAVTWTNAATEAEGAGLLAAHGFHGRSAASAWDTRATTLRASGPGLDVLVAMRDHLGLLPDDFPGVDSIWDARALDALGID